MFAENAASAPQRDSGDSLASNPPSKAPGAGGGGGAPRPSVHRYSFQIGSVESFERHLEDAQRSFGWAPEDFVPVIYTNPEISLFDEALKFAPTLLLIAALIWTTRSTMRGIGGGMGGGRGGRNIFNVGKASVRYHDNLSVAYSCSRPVCFLGIIKKKGMNGCYCCTCVMRFHLQLISAALDR